MSFPQGLLDAFETAQHSIFRLETLQHYAGDPNFARFLAGEQWQDTDSKRHWCDLVRRKTSEGVTMQRVHVVIEPLTDYMRFELSWSYPQNAEAGEDISVLPTEKPWTPLDFWLFDDAQLWVMLYDEDGSLTEVRRETQVEVLRSVWKLKRIAVSSAVPLDRYMAHA